MLSSVANRAVEESLVQLHAKDNFYQSVSSFPMPFALINTALQGIIKEAKDQRVTMVDEGFLEMVRANRNG